MHLRTLLSVATVAILAALSGPSYASPARGQLSSPQNERGLYCCETAFMKVLFIGTLVAMLLSLESNGNNTIILKSI
ncbi:MAG: hypothetical protein DHS80DRAFT_28729 [Piptocephalis tieghemiana]|nr:MAG: hypothetical protein DHS80DRAFT_28729 [Piptocephalis tieghemiana]